ncbi:NAD-dependent epimerase/dehydratase family protein [Glutamicibacter sp. PS]|uniref:NAD-dependent epimerase/dehydratase family protein n=1 Tax=Glutamicibacter sp. PS TaxID=3075634 RepID=UPI0028453359|nr:NAD-dependent epimerase/dehydratase family protein [Glutamicibacter sp. PS]MDR4533578.1 NAD-dependent epimerase/dehydratase family protein [Glutamicibacter sp. PS]
MRLLVLGGTAWLGSQLVQTALAQGHQVTCVARGSTIPEGAELVRLDRDQADALHTLGTARWDAVLDVSRQPGHVRRAARYLEPYARHYLFISSGNVYRDLSVAGTTEKAPLLPPLEADIMQSMEDYGSAKVACEEAILDQFTEQRATILRAGLIAGPADPTDRTSYWPTRMLDPHRRTPAIVPDALEQDVSMIDVRDLAAWAIDLLETQTSGIYNAAGERHSFAEHLRVARSMAEHAPALCRAPETWLHEHGVQQWAGARSLPLWLTENHMQGMNAMDNSLAVAAGLCTRPLQETLRDAATERLARLASDPWRSGLQPHEEQELIAALATTRPVG